MTITDQAPFEAFALNAEAGAPEWVQLTPPGPVITGRDGRTWTINTEAVLANFADRGGEFVIDVEHATSRKAPLGEPALAAGWIKELAVRDGAIWGRAAWNDEARAWIEARQYRFLSPHVVFRTDTRQIDLIKNVGLTNTPNFQMAALNSEGIKQETQSMDKAILEALGLNAEATTADAVQAITTLKTEKASALNSAAHPDPDKFVPIATHKTATARIEELEAAQAKSAEDAINAELDAAIEAGKIAPADREFYAAACNSEGGLDRFRASMETRSPIVGAADPKKPSGKSAALNAEEASAVEAMGMSVADYTALKASEE